MEQRTFKFLEKQNKVRFGEREADLLAAVFDWLKIRGIFAWRMPIGPVMRGGGKTKIQYSKSPIKGFPDIAGVLRRRDRGRLFVLELKTSKGELTPEQVKWLIDLQAAGAAGAVVRSIDDLYRAMREWGEVD